MNDALAQLACTTGMADPANDNLRLAFSYAYVQGGSAAVADLASFEAEFSWQCGALRSLGAQFLQGESR